MNLVSNNDAKVALVKSVEFGTVVLTKHFREELKNDDFTMEDVLLVCRSGSIRTAPEPDIRTGDWKHRIEGFTLDGRSLAVVFCVRTNDVVFITVFGTRS